MISLALAQELKTAGLAWKPAMHDFFAIPDRGMDMRSFVISDMPATVERLFGTAVVAFQGSSEWALDYLITSEAVWMPTETQLRETLETMIAGPGVVEHPIVTLTCSPPEYRCAIIYLGHTIEFKSVVAADAYGQALLFLLQNQPGDKETQV